MVLVWVWMVRRRMRAGGGLVDVGGLTAEGITKVLPLFGWYYQGITTFRVVLPAGGGIT